ncbi:MAG: hypothetical protein DHS20C02_00230 [Micavibrio sp.]|nr:MAG: hypothetical protein DHS20C02_00230 [Micavibrio sp.]
MNKLLRAFVAVATFGVGDVLSADTSKQGSPDQWFPATGKFLGVRGQGEHKDAVFEGPKKLGKGNNFIYFNEAVSCGVITREGAQHNKIGLRIEVGPQDFEQARLSCMVSEV